MAALALAFVALAWGDAAAPAGAGTPPAIAAAASEAWQLDELLEAIRVVETGGLKDGGRRATGDGGRAIGPYQIHRPYWEDSRIPGRHDDCRDPVYARRVVLAYWKRYASKALETLDVQALARVHNGGPDGARQDCTLAFWRKVERALAAAREKRALEAATKEKGKALEGGAKKPKTPAPTPPAKKGAEYC